MTVTDLSIPEPGEGDDAERYLLILWCSVVLLCCLAGNTIVLVFAIRCKTIRLDRTSVVLIKNIAVSDIAMGVFAVHPTLASLGYGTWPYGGVLCSVFHYLQVTTYFSAVLLICGFHLNKLYIITYPLCYVGRATRTGHVISGIAWLLCIVVPATQIAVDVQSVQFVRTTYRCMYFFIDPAWKRILPLMGFVFTAFPTILVGGTTAALVYLVRRATGRLNRQGIMVALNVGCLYLLANLPLSVYFIIYKNLHQLMSPEVKYFFDFYVYRTSFFMLFMNCSCNFFVYFYSVRSFNIFVKRAFLSLYHGRKSRLGARTFRLRNVKRFSKNT